MNIGFLEKAYKATLISTIMVNLSFGWAGLFDERFIQPQYKNDDNYKSINISQQYDNMEKSQINNNFDDYAKILDNLESFCDDEYIDALQEIKDKEEREEDNKNGIDNLPEYGENPPPDRELLNGGNEDEVKEDKLNNTEINDEVEQNTNSEKTEEEKDTNEMKNPNTNETQNYSSSKVEAKADKELMNSSNENEVKEDKLKNSSNKNEVKENKLDNNTEINNVGKENANSNKKTEEKSDTNLKNNETNCDVSKDNGYYDGIYR